MRKFYFILVITIITLLTISYPSLGISLSAYGNFDLNTMINNPMIDGGIYTDISNLTTGLRFYAYKKYPMLSRESPLYMEYNPTCYLGQYFIEYNLKPFKLAFKHNFFRTNKLPSEEEIPDFSFLRDAFPNYSLGAYYIYEGDISALIGLSYGFNNKYTTELMVEKHFWKRFTFGAKNTTYMYLTKKGWSMSGAPICQLYEVYLKLHISDYIYVYYNDWCYHPVVSEGRKSAYYNQDSHDPIGLSIGMNIHLK